MKSSNNVKVLPENYNMESVLFRKWRLICFLSWIIFLTYGILISIQFYVFSEPLCGVSPRAYGAFYSVASVSALSGFLFTFLMLAVKIVQASPGKERIPSMLALNVIAMGLLFTVLVVVFNWDGICIDALGVATPAMMWAEWLSNSPTIVFLTGKKNLNRVEYTVIATFFACCVFGFLPIIPQPQFLAYIWISMSALTCIPLLALPWYLSLEGKEFVGDIEQGKSKPLSTGRRKKQQLFLAYWMTVVCPLFPLNYFLAAAKVIGPGESVGVFLLLTLVLKALFAASLADAHAHALMDAEHELERERQANESRRAFLKYLFHEVRTPLNSLTMGIELLKTKESLDSSDKELLAMMTGASDFMAETLNDVLSMQKIEEGKLELIYAPFNINHSITKILSALSGGAMEKNLQIEEDIAADVPALLSGDVYRVEHVISNLISNSMKFSPHGGIIQVKVTAKEIAQPPPHKIQALPSTNLTVSIIDQGPGISAENQSKLFDGFFQVRPDQLQQGKGSGLGLALCKQIVSLHGGTIGVKSAEGQGSTFHFTIPFSIPNDVVIEPEVKKDDEEVDLEFRLDEPQPTSVSNIRASIMSTNSNIRASIMSTSSNCESVVLSDPEFSPCVLVVDDVLSNRKMLTALLQKNGATEVDMAENGLEAVETALANIQKYDMIFMDNLMPVMNGPDAARKLREEGYGNLVIGVTGNALDTDVSEYLSAGADLVLGKPVKLSMLKMVLRHVKENGHLSRPNMTLVEVDRCGLLTWRAKA